MEDPFCVVTRSNFQEISRAPTAQEGILLVGNVREYSSPPGKPTGAFEIDVFDCPSLELDDHKPAISISNPNTRNINQSLSRSYSLRRKPERTGDPDVDCARRFFETLPVGNNGEYQFQISPQCVLGCGADFSLGFVVFVYESEHMRDALFFLLQRMFFYWNHHDQHDEPPFVFTDTESHIIADYADADMKTGRVVQKNIAAGREADAMMGM